MTPGPDSIGDYALLSDSHGSALVSRAGSIDWACLPRFDRPSVFARILGPDAGHWRISPAGTAEVERAYLDETIVLQTVFRTPSGTAALIDAMPFGPSERGHRIGRDAPHAIVRVVKGLEGEAKLELEFRPRPEYGLTTPMLLAHPGGLRTRGGPRAYVLSSGIPLEAEDGVARGCAGAHRVVASGCSQRVRSVELAGQLLGVLPARPAASRWGTVGGAWERSARRRSRGSPRPAGGGQPASWASPSGSSSRISP